MPSTLTVGGAWFVTSAVASTYANTAFLRAFPDPLAHMLVRFGGAAAVGLAANAVAPKGGKGKPGSHIPPSEFPRVARAMLVPALCLLCANFANSVALQLSGITSQDSEGRVPLDRCRPAFRVELEDLRMAARDCKQSMRLRPSLLSGHRSSLISSR